MRPLTAGTLAIYKALKRCKSKYFLSETPTNLEGQRVAGLKMCDSRLLPSNKNSDVDIFLKLEVIFS